MWLAGIYEVNYLGKVVPIPEAGYSVIYVISPGPPIGMGVPLLRTSKHGHGDILDDVDPLSCSGSLEYSSLQVLDE